MEESSALYPVMGWQVASSGCNNFSFFSRSPAITSPATLAPYLANSLLRTREEIAAGQLVYDPSTTYMSLIVGDGDNIAFMKGGRRGWMKVVQCSLFCYKTY